MRALRAPVTALASGMLVVAATSCGGGDTADTEGDAAPSATSSSESSSSTSSAASDSSSASISSTAGGSTGGSAQTQAALAAIATAQGAVQGGQVFDLEDEVEGGQRVWEAKVATPDGRQSTLDIAQDGSSVLTNDEDPSPDDDVRKLQAAQVRLEDAIATAAGQAQGAGDLTALEVDTTNQDTLVWQVDFGGDDGTTVLVDATTGAVVDAGPDVG